MSSSTDRSHMHLAWQRSFPTRPRIDDYAGGPGRRAASLLWRNRDDDFPAWAGRDLTARDPSAHLDLLASDGATSTTVAHEQLGKLHRLELTPTLATVTMGGNDRRRRIPE
jgi:hypothetical protein